MLTTQTRPGTLIWRGRTLIGRGLGSQMAVSSIWESARSSSISRCISQFLLSEAARTEGRQAVHPLQSQRARRHSVKKACCVRCSNVYYERRTPIQEFIVLEPTTGAFWVLDMCCVSFVKLKQVRMATYQETSADPVVFGPDRGFVGHTLSPSKQTSSNV